MKIAFHKYQGTGNDFILIDNRLGEYNSLSSTQIRQICDRRFGVGADGLMLLEEHDIQDFKMVYFNSDGSGSTMCGNGGRCIVAFAHKLGIIQNKTSFEAIDGQHDASIDENGNVSLKMSDVSNIEINEDHYYLNTGSPHYVQFVKDPIKNIDVFKQGRAIRYSERFATVGTNVNFVQLTNDGLFVRTYERGVENETYSCGTGVTASAISAAIETNTHEKAFNIETFGGKLRVMFNRNGNNFNNIYLNGPATFVFEGTLYL
jgi:diaminopimelate epimerase